MKYAPTSTVVLDAVTFLLLHQMCRRNETRVYAGDRLIGEQPSTAPMLEAAGFIHKFGHTGWKPVYYWTELAADYCTLLKL